MGCCEGVSPALVMLPARETTKCSPQPWTDCGTVVVTRPRPARREDRPDWSKLLIKKYFNTKTVRDNTFIVYNETQHFNIQSKKFCSKIISYCNPTLYCKAESSVNVRCYVDILVLIRSDGCFSLW